MATVFFLANFLLFKQKEQNDFGTHEDVFKESASSEKKTLLAVSSLLVGLIKKKEKEEKVE